MNSYIQYDDGTLVYLLSKGDEAAFTVIYQRYWKSLYALPYDRLKSKETTEDIIREVFTGRLWQRRSVL